MATLPSAYIDNVTLNKATTLEARGNSVSDCYGKNVIGIEVKNSISTVVKNNKAVRIRANGGISRGLQVSNCTTAMIIYNVASRADVGVELDNIPTLDVYNATVHNCDIEIRSSSSGTFRNIALTAGQDWKLYKGNVGFFATGSAVLNVGYIKHFGLGVLGSGHVTLGSHIENARVLYIDEENDDLTPDYISVLVNSGTENPLRVENPDIGGIESSVALEQTAQIKYFYNLLDNSFWNVEKQQSGEVSFIKALQSRIFAQSEVINSQVKRDYFIKTMESALGFSSLFPMYARYQNGSKFNRKVGMLWYATQNAATTEAYNTSIGGYNVLPSFFKRLEDWTDAWIIGQSAIDIDNWLVGLEGQRYGIYIDFLGTSTISESASGECHNNVMASVADIAPVKWFLHNEVQPSGYLMFTDMWNDFENCALTNMIYNDDFAISIDQIGVDCQAVTPLLDTTTLAVSGVGVSGGEIEVSLLDRIWSENLDRHLFYRQGESAGSMSSWTEIKNTVGGYFSISSSYVQLRIAVSNVARRSDYEFIGLCLRGYESARDSTPPQTPTIDEAFYLEFEGGIAIGTTPPEQEAATLVFDNDGTERQASWILHTPLDFITKQQHVVRMCFGSRNSAFSGVAQLGVEYGTISIFGSAASIIVTNTIPVPITVGKVTYVDLDISAVINSDSDMLVFRISRDSDDAGDTLASALMYLNGRTV